MRVICYVFAVWIGMQVVPVDAAVEFLTGVNRDTITIGDPFVFRLRTTHNANDRVEVAFGEDFPKPFEIRKTGQTEKKQLGDGRVQETQDIVLTIYDVGAFVIPPVSLHFVSAAGDSGRIQSQPVAVLVQSVKPEGTTDIRDIKPPVDMEAQVPLWVWGALAGIVLLLGALIWYLRRRQQRPEIEAPPAPINWLEELQKIERLNLLEEENYRQYYSLLSDVLRRCIEAKTVVPAVERTTFEIGRDLRRQDTDAEWVTKVVAVLNEADRVKFAKFSPGTTVAKETMAAAREIVQQLIKPPVVEDAVP